MRENFDAALSAVLKHEGGWSDHPKDPGGATMKGITLATYRRHRPGATKDQLRNISEDEIKRIYREGYWDKIRGDDLPSGIDYAVFDFAVNSGPSRAAISLQTLVGAAPDGKIGPQTIKSIATYVGRFGIPQLVNELCSHRLAFLERLSTWPTFGRGWRSRVAGVRELATQMANDPIQPPTLQPAPKPIPIDTPDDHEPAVIPTPDRGIPAWLWVVGALALVAALVFFTPIF